MSATPDLSRDWGTAPVWVPHPAPEVRSRAAEPGEIPKGARDMIRHAERHGWSASAYYSRGTRMDHRGKPGGVVDAIGVRFVRGAEGAPGARYATALWVDGKFWRAWIARVGAEFPLGVNATELRAHLTAEGV